ncbi:unnamed protein product [Aureobasidium pullulans]|nr:unnamed protein product [Aureobasidium pullulans]
MKPSRYSIIFARGFLLLLVTLLLPTSEASYHIQVVDIGAAACNSDVIAGALLGVRWSIDNSSAADGDQCGLAIRSMLNTIDDDAYVTNSTTRSIGIAGIVCGVVGALVGALIAAGFSYYVERRREKKHGQAAEPLLPLAQGTAPNTAPGAAQPAEMPNTPEVGTPVRPPSPV